MYQYQSTDPYAKPDKKGKKKKKRKQRQLIAKIVGITLLLTLVFFVLSVSEYGMNFYQGRVDKSRHKSWAPGLQWRIGKVNEFFGRNHLAAKAFNLYIVHHGKLDPEKTQEAYYRYFSNLKDARQYKTCLKLCEQYLDNNFDVHEGKMDKNINNWYPRVQAIRDNLILMSESKRYDHPVY